MKRSILIAAIMLASCAPKPPVQVSVPVPVPCLKPADVPALPSDLPAMPDDANAALSLAIDKLVDWSRYGKEADSKLRACSQIR